MLRSAARMAAPAAVMASLAWTSSASAADDEDLFIVKTALNPKQWKDFECIEKKQLTHNTARLRFALPPHHELGMTTASCLVARADIDGKTVVRPYTPTSREHDKGFFDLVVKTYPEGKLSKHMFGLDQGDFLEFKGPFKKLDISSNSKKAIGMIAGGTGITPMLQVIQKLLDVYYTVTEPGEGWTGFTGFVDADKVAATLPPPSDDHLVLVCGPPPMVKAMSGGKAKDKSQGPLEGLLKEMKYTSEQVFKF
ncbi:CBR2 [Symbiodinium sp. KB8]|nr:CBR2 [Symbiodinium sp. KB8]